MIFLKITTMAMRFWIIVRIKTCETRTGREHCSSTEVLVAVTISDHYDKHDNHDAEDYDEDEARVMMIMMLMLMIMMIMIMIRMRMRTFHSCLICRSWSGAQKQPGKDDEAGFDDDMILILMMI